MSKECRNDIAVTQPAGWPRSCPRCGLGPCTNLENQTKHLAFQKVHPDALPGIMEHAGPQYDLHLKLNSALRNSDKLKLDLVTLKAPTRILLSLQDINNWIDDQYV